MPIGTARLSLLPFPQSWDGTSLVVRFLCLPKGAPPQRDPRAPIMLGQPAFATAKLVFEAHLIGSLAQLPLSGDATPTGALAIDPPPNGQPPEAKANLFDELAKQFNITAPGAAGPKPVFRKSLTESYSALIGNRLRSQYLSTADEFDCAMHSGALDQPSEPAVLTNDVTWNKVIALALRQPNLASAMGLLLQTTITPADPAFFAAGGWLYIDLHASSDYAAVAGIAARYAARIPALGAGPLPLFAPLLFPVTDAAGGFLADDVFREAERYQDGLAKIVHSAQTPEPGDGIQLAWEDEQIAEWLNRLVQRDDAGELPIDAPLGVSGYRIDVREAGGKWNSLVAVRSVDDLKLGDISLGRFDGEAVVEVSPSQISPEQPGAFWFPSYFATWRGYSLSLSDADLVRLHARGDVKDADTPPNLLGRDKNFAPVGDKAVPLRYGHTYDFRVRMADLTRGGPDSSVPSPEPPGHSVTTVTFQRRKAPGPVEIVKRPPDVARELHIARPRLGYPEILFAGGKFEDLETDLNQLSAGPSVTREISLRDPDVVAVRILVQARALDGDTDLWMPLYETTRKWTADEMILTFDVQDPPTLLTLKVDQPDSGSLVLPSARDLRLTLTGIGKDDPGYFATADARIGAAVNIDLRAAAATEAPLLVNSGSFSALRSFFFQPPPPDNTVAAPIERLAGELDLIRTGLTLSGGPDGRVVMACSAHLRHTLSPEASAITFASSADLVQRWVNVVQFTLERDWAWNGLDPAGISVTRIVHLPKRDIQEVVGAITLPRALAPQVRSKLKAALPAGSTGDPRAAIRQSAEVIFFDAYDPKPIAPDFPSEVTVDYILQPVYPDVAPPDPVTASILLPVTTPPSQVPNIVSAGIALSDYVKADDYSSTDPRQRMLWFEFAEAPADLEDAYFVRVRGAGPDPMLIGDVIPPETIETPLALDPEWMRLITPGQPHDENGLNAMQVLGPSPAPPHYLVPLPPNLSESSPELFGFFVYEIRVGHTESRWCTAQGRYGPLLRVAGVQHPAPPLICQATRARTGILVRAPFATPVIDGANARLPFPATDLWALLYARVPQMDRQAFRNLLIARTRLLAPFAGNFPVGEGLRVLYGEGLVSSADLATALSSLGLEPGTPLTVLAAELLADVPQQDPLGAQLPGTRTLRISPLASVRDAC
jgi:hypothetical protein